MGEKHEEDKAKSEGNQKVDKGKVSSATSPTSLGG